jgi:hypothetical protein
VAYPQAKAAAPAAADVDQVAAGSADIPGAAPMPAHNGGAPAPAPKPANMLGVPSANPNTGAKTTGAKAETQVDATVASAMVIYTGGVNMMEDQEKIPALIDKIVDLSESMGGRLHARRDDGVTIRVPSSRFRDTMTKIDALGAVTHRSVKAEDVSEEYHDAEVRLMNLKATRQRLQDFLAKANNITETLTVERELERIAVDIDRLQGRMTFLKERASLSTIDVQIAAKPKPAVAVVVQPPPPPPPISPKGIELPIEWLEQLDANHLSTLSK